jgi:hypothetical protein
MSTTASFSATWYGDVVEDSVARSNKELSVREWFHRPWYALDGIKLVEKFYDAVRLLLLPDTHLKQIPVDL